MLRTFFFAFSLMATSAYGVSVVQGAPFSAASEISCATTLKNISILPATKILMGSIHWEEIKPGNHFAVIGAVRTAVRRLVEETQLTAIQKKILFDQFRIKMLTLTHGHWNADLARSSDGAYVFYGGNGHMIVIATNGDIYKGFCNNQFAYNKIFGFPPVFPLDYSTLEKQISTTQEQMQ